MFREAVPMFVVLTVLLVAMTTSQSTKFRRLIALLSMVAFGIWLTLLGNTYLIGVINPTIPAPLLGLFVLGCALLGFLGINIWRGSPLESLLNRPEADTRGRDNRDTTAEKPWFVKQIHSPRETNGSNAGDR